VFVPFTAPGDRVRVRVTEVRARYSRGRVEALLAPGPERVEPVCPAFGSCGGCAWQHVDYGAQLAAKVRIVEDALARIGGVAFAGGIEAVASPAPYGTRSRARVLRQGERLGYRRRRSRAVHPVTRCPVLTPDLDAALHELATSPPPSTGGEEEWEIAQGDGPVRVARLGGAVASGPDRISLPTGIGGEPLEVSPGVFFQANAALRESLAQAVLASAGTGRHVIEAFAGAGFFTLGLARAFERVTAIESDPGAVADLRRNLAVAGYPQVSVLDQRLEQALPRVAEADVVVLDPPRTGLPAGCAESLARLAKDRLVYLSCDPATLSRDLAAFGSSRLGVRQVTVFDLFPQTPHVETLVRLEPMRGPGGAGLVHSSAGDR
jgi:23S rRNA (uracil1939-C5)-methyltransferase